MCLLFLTGLVLIDKSSILFLQDKATLSIMVQSVIIPIVCPGCLCHMSKGGCNCSFCQMSMISFSEEGAFSKCLGKALYDDVLLISGETVEEYFLGPDAVEERVPKFPSTSSLGSGTKGISSWSGNGSGISWTILE